jgi:hypothetical protein
MDERLRDRLDDLTDEVQALLAYSQWLRDHSRQLRQDSARLQLASRQLADPSL